MIELAGRKIFGCRLTSSQQSCIKYANPNISTCLAVALLVKRVYYILLSIDFFNVHILDEQQTVGMQGGKPIRTHMHATYICLHL
jgi:hypothetical protein